VHKLITLWRIVVAGTHNFFRNAWLSAAATAIMTVTLTVMLSAIILNAALTDTLKEITNRIDIAIFLEDEATEAQIESIQNELRQIENVQSVSFVSKTDALNRYRAQYRDNPTLLAAITEEENPLPQAIEFQVKDLNQIEPIILVTQKEEYIPIVQSTSYEDRQRIIKRIADINSFLVNAGVIVSSLFTAISILIIFNTIRMAIFSRGEEIQIMRLIGASNGYIRGPFIFEAMLNGVMAAVISLAFGYIVLFAGAPKLLSYVNFSNTLSFFEQYWTLVGIGTMLIGMFIGALSSILAMMRYLRL
jgi:cell division transport system permease protein